MLRNDPMTHAGRRPGFCRMKKCCFRAVTVLSPPPCPPQGSLSMLGGIHFLTEINLGARPSESWREVPWVCGRRVPAAQCVPRGGGGGPVPALGVCRSEARQSCGMICVSCSGAGEVVAPVPCTCCPKRFPAYIIPVPEKLESLLPRPHKCERK